MDGVLSGLLGWVALLGGFLLIGVMAFGVVMNKRQARSEVERSERGAKALRDEIDWEDKARDAK